MIISDISLKYFSSELEKTAISMGFLNKAIVGRLGKTIVESPEKAKFIESFTSHTHPQAIRATQSMGDSASMINKAAPKGSSMSMGDFNSRMASQESGMPLGKAPNIKPAPASDTTIQKPGIFKRFVAPVGRGLAGGAALTGVALAGGGAQAFASNPYQGTSY